jgi:membrane associated rhomboid family serine protease
VKRWWRGQSLVGTYAIITVNVVVFVLTLALDGRLDGLGSTARDLALVGPLVHGGDYYRLVTYSVVHYGVLHILFNMLILSMVGRVLEPGTGTPQFVLLYVVSVLGGAAGALVVSPNALTGGASGGVFGVAGAATLVLTRQGLRFSDTAFGPLLVINLVLSFAIPNVSIGGHVGGLVAGVAAAEAMLQARRIQQPWLGFVGALAVGAAAVVVALAAAAP